MSEVRKKLNRRVPFEHQQYALKKHKHQQVEDTYHTFTVLKMILVHLLALYFDSGLKVL